jgi:hypothetical protein
MSTACENFVADHRLEWRELEEAEDGELLIRLDPS